MLTLRRRSCNQQRAFTRAFTLVEILIVVIILGILATVIIALFNNTSADAGKASLRDNLRSMRSQIQFYVAQHGAYPALSTFEAQMTMYTDAQGNTSASRTATALLGPYVLQLPVLPVGTNRGLRTVTGTTYAAGYGWSYDQTTGTFKANLPDTDVDTDGIKFNTY